jgi:hypothetical protein
LWRAINRNKEKDDMAVAIDLTNADANWELISKLNKDLRDSAALMGRSEARYLVDLYYAIQEQRQRAASQSRTSDDEEPNNVTDWLFKQFKILENDIKKSLGVYASSQVPGQWAQSIHGIGPVIAAGLLAHIDVSPWKCIGKSNDRCKPSDPHPEGHCHHVRVSTAGGVWRFAGLDPTLEWKKGQKRPHNAKLKRLAWIIGDSFCKQRASDKDFYGKYYEERKAYEQAKNEAGDYADLASQKLETHNIRDAKLKATYESGKLPDGRIELRSRRYATKLFLAHYHHVAHFNEFGTSPPDPYAIAHLNHAHYIPPPNFIGGKVISQ